MNADNALLGRPSARPLYVAIALAFIIFLVVLAIVANVVGALTVPRA